MWRKAGRSSALDRAQALLSARRSGSEGGHRPGEDPLTAQGCVTPRGAQTDLSDPSPPCSASLSDDGASTKEGRAQSSVGGGRRFPKKPPVDSDPDLVSLSRTQRPSPPPQLTSITERRSTRKVRAPPAGSCVKPRKLPSRIERHQPERGGGSPDSDEEDMRRLLGDEVFLSGQHKTPPPHTAQTGQTSPFRFTGQAHAHFSPTGISPRSPPLSTSSMWAGGDLLSLDELFPLREEGASSDLDSLSTGDFHMEVITLDHVIPLGFPTKTIRKEEKGEALPTAAAPGLDTHRPQEEEEQKEYPSDFESDVWTESPLSAGLVSQQQPRNKDGEEEEESEVREEEEDLAVTDEEEDLAVTDEEGSAVTDEEESLVKGEAKFPISHSSDTSHPSQISKATPPSRRSSSHPRRRSPSHHSRSSSSHHSRSSSSHPSRRKRVQSSVTVKDAAVQTDPGAPPPRDLYASSSFSPSTFFVHEVLKQQLTITRDFLDRNRRLHAVLLQSLEPPTHGYTTLEDTTQLINNLRRSRLTTVTDRDNM